MINHKHFHRVRRQRKVIGEDGGLQYRLELVDVGWARPLTYQPFQPLFRLNPLEPGRERKYRMRHVVVRNLKLET